MTVSYHRHMAHSNCGGLARLLFKWRGSLYRIIYKELFLFIIAFGMVSAIYRNVLSDSTKLTFNKAILYCEALEKLLPLPFILGFYVTNILHRWWNRFQTIPWPDAIMNLLTLSVVGNKEEYDRMMLRSLMRYANLSLILVLRSISLSVKQRFPKLEDFVNAGLMTTEELELFQSVPNADITTDWIPSTWFMQLLREGCQRGRFQIGLAGIIAKEFNTFREKCDRLWSYDWLPMPLVYTQVVTLITYGYFFIALIGRQHIDELGPKESHLQTEFDKYISIISILQILFFLGLLKVAEQLINPFGDDEEDFELNWLIDRNIKVSYLGIDMVMKPGPTLVKDSLWDAKEISIPYPPDAEHFRKKTYLGSVARTEFPTKRDTKVTTADNFEEKKNDISTGLITVNRFSKNLTSLSPETKKNPAQPFSQVDLDRIDVHDSLLNENRERK